MPGGDGPEDVDAEPAQPERAELVRAQHAEAEQHEREGRAVVEPGLAGQREAQPVAIPRVGGLDVGREHGVGRREHGPEHDGGADRQPQHERADERHPARRQRHGDGGQEHGRDPAAVPQRRAQLEPGGQQRHEDDELGNALDEPRVVDRVQHDDVQHRGPEADPGAEVDHRRARRQPADHAPAHGHADEQRARHEVRELEVHAPDECYPRQPRARTWPVSRNSPAGHGVAPRMETIDARALHERLERGDAIVLLDARRTEEYEREHLPGALGAMSDHIIEWAPSLVPDCDRRRS